MAGFGRPMTSAARTAVIRAGSDLGHGCFFAFAGVVTAAAGFPAGRAICVCVVPAGFWNSGRSQRISPRLSSSARS